MADTKQNSFGGSGAEGAPNSKGVNVVSSGYYTPIGFDPGVGALADSSSKAAFPKEGTKDWWSKVEDLAQTKKFNAAADQMVLDDMLAAKEDSLKEPLKKYKRLVNPGWKESIAAANNVIAIANALNPATKSTQALQVGIGLLP
jgi:hypothetical protein